MQAGRFYIGLGRIEDNTPAVVLRDIISEFEIHRFVMRIEHEQEIMVLHR